MRQPSSFRRRGRRRRAAAPRQPSRAVSGIPQQVFDMRIDTAKFILRPSFQHFVQFRIEAQRELLFSAIHRGS